MSYSIQVEPGEYVISGRSIGLLYNIPIEPAFYDTNGKKIPGAAISLSPSDTKTASVQIGCNTGYYLSGHAVADVIVEAKHSAAGGWTNIETTPIDLSTWNRSIETFQIRASQDSIDWTTLAASDIYHLLRKISLTIARA